MKKQVSILFLVLILLGICLTPSVSAYSSYSKSYYVDGNEVEETWSFGDGWSSYSKFVFYKDWTSNYGSITLWPAYYEKNTYKSYRNDATSYQTSKGYKVSTTYTQSGAKTYITVTAKKPGNVVAKGKIVHVIRNGKTYSAYTNSYGKATFGFYGNAAEVKKYSFVYW